MFLKHKKDVVPLINIKNPKSCYRVYDGKCFMTKDSWNDYATNLWTKYHLLQGIFWAIIFSVAIATAIAYMQYAPTILLVGVVGFAFVGWWWAEKKYRLTWGLIDDNNDINNPKAGRKKE